MVLKKNAEYFPESVRIKMMMAMINDKAGNTDEAIKLYQEVLKLDPENKGAKERLSRLKQ
jgi:predicted TPR repeat methyltransferase